jgi:hypothetical protein
VRRLLRGYRASPVAGALLLVLTAAILVLLLGPHSEEAPAFVVIALVVTLLVVGSSPIGTARRLLTVRYMRGVSTSTGETRESGPGPAFTDAADPHVEEEAWQQERERREHTDGGPRPTSPAD